MMNVAADTLASDLEKYLQIVAGGETIVVMVRDQAVAELRSTVEMMGSPRPFGLAAGEFVVGDDFDSPLPEEILATFENE